jgi:hypothetical protein
MFTPTALRLLIVLGGMLTLPGWAVLSFTDNWCQWRGLQRWIVAVGISIAFYPVLFYGMRSLFPFLTLGPYKMSALLLGCAAIIGWRMRGHWKEQIIFDRLEWVTLAVFGMTLFTRFWIIRDHPYPAWSDSLHHTLLTQLTAVQGRLPFDMEPYFPIPLGQYHLGLYALSATVQWLAQVPAHTAVLWTAQMLNGLCGVGVYLVLDRKVGRLGAIVGAAVVGLWSHQPAWYVNWGRFTQLSSQTVLLIAWLMTWEAVASWKRPWRECKAGILWNTACAAVLTGGVFLLHFRVAVFYIPLLAVSITWELWKARKGSRVGPKVALGTIVIGIAALVVVAPALWEAAHIHVSAKLNLARSSQSGAVTQEALQTVRSLYYEFPLRTVQELAASPWLIVLAGLGIVVGLLRCNKLTIASLLWVVTLCLFGNAYLLGLPLLAFTNLGAVLIMLYLPLGLIVGSATEDVLALRRPLRREHINRLVTTLVLITCFLASHVRVTEIEQYRYFVTSQDIQAMDWIRENTPSDARFAVNTYFWLPHAPHGTDAGYWIPYFTERRTTADTMLFSHGTADYVSSIVEMSRAADQLELDNTSLAKLHELGVDYVYIGRQGDFSGPGLSVERLSQAENVHVLYQRAGVSILQIE